MTSITRLAILLSLLGSLGILLDSCNNNDDPSAWDITIDALVNDGKAWVVNGGSVEQDQAPVTESFESFRITFSNTLYAAEGGGDIWPDTPGASWVFEGTDPNNASVIIRADDIRVQISVVKGDQLTMTFSVSTPGGRTEGLMGDYVFNLKSSGS